MTARPLPRMRAARAALGMTQSQLGAMIGKTGSHLAKIERGESGLSAHDALTLAQHLGLTVESLLKVNA